MLARDTPRDVGGLKVSDLSDWTLASCSSKEQQAASKLRSASSWLSQLGEERGSVVGGTDYIPADPDDPDQVYEIERILSAKKEGGRFMILVKWTGYPDATYVPRKQLLEDCGDPEIVKHCLLYTSPSPRDRQKSRMPSSA